MKQRLAGFYNVVVRFEEDFAFLALLIAIVFGIAVVYLCDVKYGNGAEFINLNFLALGGVNSVILTFVVIPCTKVNDDRWFLTVLYTFIIMICVVEQPDGLYSSLLASFVGVCYYLASRGYDQIGGSDV